jgi:hypothetical protein
MTVKDNQDRGTINGINGINRQTAPPCRTVRDFLIKDRVYMGE